MTDDSLEQILLRSLTIVTSLAIATSVHLSPVNAAGLLMADAAVETPVQQVKLAADGPEIQLLKPENGGIYTSPIGIEIAFAPKDGATIDLSTLKVTVVSTTLAGVFEIDITEDIIGYATQEGIKAPDAQIPVGEHVVTIEVADSEHRLSQSELEITVRQESVLERRAKE